MARSKRPITQRGAAEPVRRQKPAGGASESTTIAGEKVPGLPHDRDESPHSTGGERHPDVEQAARDVERGLQDTTRAPESDAAYHRLRKR
jgi:hypothetical protein